MTVLKLTIREEGIQKERIGLTRISRLEMGLSLEVNIFNIFCGFGRRLKKERNPTVMKEKLEFKRPPDVKTVVRRFIKQLILSVLPERLAVCWLSPHKAIPDRILSLTGVLASLTAPLAEAGVSIFAISTYDTDYLLVRNGDYGKPKEVLVEHGHHLNP